MSRWSMIRGSVELNTYMDYKNDSNNNELLNITTPHLIKHKKSIMESGKFDICVTTIPAAKKIAKDLISKYMPSGESYIIDYSITDAHLGGGSTNWIRETQILDYIDKHDLTDKVAYVNTSDSSILNINDNVRYCTNEQLVFALINLLKAYKRRKDTWISEGTFRITGWSSCDQDYNINIDDTIIRVYAVNQKNRRKVKQILVLETLLDKHYNWKGFRETSTVEWSSNVGLGIINEEDY